MRKRIEYCCKCEEATGHAGRGEDSIYVEYENGKEVGPLCIRCSKEIFVCEKCNFAVKDEFLSQTYDHIGCPEKIKL